MKGLMIKDLRFSLQNKKTLVVFFIIAVLLLASQGEGGCTFIIAYMTMGYGMLVLNTVSVDEFDKSNVFLMTLPITKKMYVLEKYLFALLCSLSGWVISIIVCSVVYFERVREEWISALVILAVFVLFQLITLPIQLEFGGDKGRIVLVGIAAFIVVAAVGAGKIYSSQAALQQWVSLLLEKLGAMPAGVTAVIAAAVWLICFAVSFLIGMRIMEKKEF